MFVSQYGHSRLPEAPVTAAIVAAALPLPTAIKDKPLMQNTTPVKLAAPSAIEIKATKTGKVINISNKTPAKPAAKVARKTKT